VHHAHGDVLYVFLVRGFDFLFGHGTPRAAICRAPNGTAFVGEDGGSSEVDQPVKQIASNAQVASDIRQGLAMASRKYAAGGMESEFEPGSRGRVLRNFLGITRVREMEAVESQALTISQETAATRYGPGHRFTSADIRRLHRLWLGRIYPWAGHYRTLNIGKGGFQFAHAPLIPGLMNAFGREVLGGHTPCGRAVGVSVARSLAEVHAELILIHPFRDGNGRVARLLSVLMARQAGVQSMDFSPLAGRWKRIYVQAIHAAMSRDYAPLEKLFARAIARPRASSSI
jgi:cell filamentation protein